MLFPVKLGGAPVLFLTDFLAVSRTILLRRCFAFPRSRAYFLYQPPVSANNFFREITWHTRRVLGWSACPRVLRPSCERILRPLVLFLIEYELAAPTFRSSRFSLPHNAFHKAQVFKAVAWKTLGQAVILGRNRSITSICTIHKEQATVNKVDVVDSGGSSIIGFVYTHRNFDHALRLHQWRVKWVSLC